jgi:hypothetical protein
MWEMAQFLQKTMMYFTILYESGQTERVDQLMIFRAYIRDFKPGLRRLQVVGKYNWLRNIIIHAHYSLKPHPLGAATAGQICASEAFVASSCRTRLAG